MLLIFVPKLAMNSLRYDETFHMAKWVLKIHLFLDGVFKVVYGTFKFYSLPTFF